MTTKRFYYNTFYHADDMSRVLEYEIIDRQSYPNYPSHDEKKDIPMWYIYISENDSGWQDMLVGLLNALHEENQALKKEIHLMHMRSMFSTVKSFKGDISTRYKYDEKMDTIYDTANHYGQYDMILDKKEIVMLLNEYNTLLGDKE